MIGKEFKINIGGKDRKLRLTFDEMTDLEKDLDIELFSLANDIIIGKKIGIRTFATIIYYGLKGSEDFMELKDVGNELLQKGILNYTRLISDFLQAALMSDEKPSEEKQLPSKT